jgi:hypothetical protein
VGATVQTTFFADEVVRLQGRKMLPAMTDIATKYANGVQLLMRDSPRTGRVYKRGSLTHRASAPGEPPAPEHGGAGLLGSVKWRVRQDGDRWFAEVGSTLPYALYLEYGAAKGNRGASGRLESVSWILFPRPAWAPALVALRPRIPGIFAKYGGR